MEELQQPKQDLYEILDYIGENRRKAPHEALSAAEGGLVLARETKNYDVLCKLHNYIGGINLQKGNAAVGKYHLFEALRIYEEHLNDLNLLAQIQLGIGSYYFDIGDFEKALGYFMDVLKFDIEPVKPALYNNIASIYLRLEHYDEAFKYLFEGLELSEKMGDDDRRIFFLYNLGSAYHFQKEFEKAIDYYTRTSQAIEAIDGYQYMHCLCLTRIGIAHNDLQDYDQALDYFSKALVISERHFLTREKIRTLRRIGETMLLRGNVEQFISYHQMCLEKSREHDLLQEELETLQNLMYFYKEHTDFKAAFEAAEQIHQLQNQLFKLERDTKVAEVANEKRFEIELLEQKNNKIAEQNRTLAKTNKELEEFAYVVAHDLREPLRSIISFTNLLERHFKREINPTAYEYMQFIVTSAKHMNALLADLLEYTTIDKTQIVVQPIPTEAVVQDILYLLKAAISESEATVVIETQLPTVTVNKVHVRQLFQQLIHNAIKFRDKNRPCVIKISARELDHHYEFCVQDNGIGIKQPFVLKIFKLFHRLDKQNYEGTGIGLAICNKITQIYNGEIWVESEEGVGSSFFFTLGK